MRRARLAFLSLIVPPVIAVACSSFEETEPGTPASDSGTTDASSETRDGEGTPPDGSSVDAGDAPYRAAVLADQPVAYWRMGKVVSGNVVPDESGRANDLTLAGAGHFTVGVPGAIGDDTAVAFDGIGGWGVAAKPAELDFAGDATFTVECWAKQTPLDGGDFFQYLVGHVRGAALDDTENGYILYLRGPVGDAEPPKAAAEYARPDAAAVGLMVTHDPTRWTHYALVVDEATVTLYLDGAPVASGARPGMLDPSPGLDFTVAKSSREIGKRWFSGVMDEIAVYPKALSTARIAAHYALRAQ